MESYNKLRKMNTKPVTITTQSQLSLSLHAHYVHFKENANQEVK